MVELPTHLVVSTDGNDDIYVGLSQTILLPSTDWKCINLPGLTDEVSITYVNQTIPSSLRQRVPVGINGYSLTTGDHQWMANIDADLQYRTLDMREYAELVYQSRRLNEVCFYMKHQLVDAKSLGNLNVPDIIQHSVSLTSEFAGQFRKHILEQDEWLYINITNFQLHFLEYFNEAYYAVSEYIWFPLLAKDEMQRDKLYLASLEIL